MKLTPRKFEEVSSLGYSIFTCPLESWTYMKCLVIEFRGECGYGSNSNGDAAFMTGIIKAADSIWHSAGLILDLRQLKYKWGDEMVKAIGALGSCRVKDSYMPFPTAIIVSDLNRNGLTSLAKAEMQVDPTELLFDDIETALSAVDRKAQQIYGRP